MAFGFKSGEPLDPRIGSWEITHSTKYRDGRPKDEMRFPLTKCKDVCTKCDDDPENLKPDSCGWTNLEM